MRNVLRGLVTEASRGVAIERARVRFAMILGSAVLVGAAGIPIAPPSMRPWVVLEVLAAPVLAASTLHPRAMRVWDRFGGVASITLIGLLVWFSGGLSSPFHLLYFLNGVFGAAFYERRRFVAETVLSVVALSAPLTYDGAADLHQVVRVAVAGAAYAAIVGTTFVLAQRIERARHAADQAWARQRSLFTHNPVATFVVDAAGRFADANPAAERLTGRGLEELRGLSYVDLVAEEDDLDAAGRVASRVWDGEVTESSRVLVRADGERRITATTGIPMLVDGKVVGLYGMARDVTDEHRSRALLEASEERHRQLVDASPAVVYLAPPGYYRGEVPLEFVNEEMEVLTGYAREAWLTDPDLVHRVVHPDDKAATYALTARFLRERRPFHAEYRMVTATGETRWVLDQARQVRGPDDEPGWVQGVILDVTARVQAEQDAQAHARAQRMLAELATDAVAATDSPVLLRRAVDVARQLLGADVVALYEPGSDGLSAFATSDDDAEPTVRSVDDVDDPVARALRDAVPVEVCGAEAATGGALSELPSHATLAMPVVISDGVYGVLAAHHHAPRAFTPVARSILGSVAALIGAEILRDRQHREVAHREAVARDQAAHLRALFDVSPLPIVELDRSGGVTLWNEAAARLSGWASEEARGRSLESLLPGSADALGAVVAAVESGRRTEPVDVVCRTRLGSALELQCFVAGRTDARGRHRGTIVFLVDVTERRALERHVVVTAKMEALGRLAGGIAHDFNNLLTVIRSTAELAGTDADPPVQADLLRIQNAVDEGASLIRELMQVGRGPEGPEVADLHAQLVADRVLLERATGVGVSLAIDAGTSALPARIAPTSLRRILLNLVGNAADATGRSGHVAIHCGPAPSDGWPSITVTDDGTGMDAVTVERMFEPFFTTKSAGRGTGLGLFGVHNLVQQHGGRIEVRSTPGQGTTVRITFRPTSAPVANDEDATAGDLSAWRGDERILLVEDDPEVRGVASRILRAAGYLVHDVATAEGAKERLERERPDLLLTDVVLPGIDGPSLVEEARRRWPDVRSLYLTGHALDVAVAAGAVIGRETFVSKPFGSDDLLRSVRRALDS